MLRHPCSVLRLAVTALAVVSCTSEGAPAPSQVTGVITEVQRAQGEIAGFTVDAGAESYDIDIDPERDYGFDLEHLEDHRRTGDPVRVDLQDRNGRPVALTIVDA
jgi:uncharacterized protein (DUF2141 family)